MALPTSSAPGRSYGEILVPELQVTARINAMASSLIQLFSGTDPLFVTLLNGGAPFSMRLMAAIARQDPNFHPQQEFMTVSFYGEDRTAATAPKVVMDLPPRYSQDFGLEGRKVLMVDDLLDRGYTAAFVDEHLRKLGAVDVSLVALGRKMIEPDLVNYDPPLLHGFDLPDVWLTGMGMDDEDVCLEANRHAGWIATARGIPAPSDWRITTPS